MCFVGQGGVPAGYLPLSGDFTRPGYEVGCSQYRPGTAEALTAAARHLLSRRPG